MRKSRERKKPTPNKEPATPKDPPGANSLSDHGMGRWNVDAIALAEKGL